jgi:hypothetical protein
VLAADPLTNETPLYMYDEFLRAAGDALASESEHSERSGRRRQRRAAAAGATTERLAMAEVVGGLVERHAREWVDGDGQVRRSLSYTHRPWVGAPQQLSELDLPEGLFDDFPLPRAWAVPPA